MGGLQSLLGAPIENTEIVPQGCMGFVFGIAEDAEPDDIVTHLKIAFCDGENIFRVVVGADQFQYLEGQPQYQSIANSTMKDLDDMGCYATGSSSGSAGSSGRWKHERTIGIKAKAVESIRDAIRESQKIQ